MRTTAPERIAHRTSHSLRSRACSQERRGQGTQVQGLHRSAREGESAFPRGSVTERVWRLHRISKWSGIAVFDKMRGPKRMSVWTRAANVPDTFRPTGVTFANQVQLFTWLLDNPTLTADG